METDLLIRGVIAPVIAAIALMFAGRGTGTRVRALAMTLVLVLSCLAQESIDTLPPRAAWQWVPLATLAATLVAVAAGERGIDRVTRCIACVLAALLACVMLPLPEWGDAGSRMLLAGGIAIASMLLLPIGMHRGGASFWIGAALSLAASATMVLATGFAKLAIPVGAVSVLALVVSARAAFASRQPLHAGIAGTIALCVILGLASAAAFAFETGSMPTWIPALAAIAPLGMWLGEAPPFRGSRLTSALSRVLGAGLPACVAATAAVLHASSPPDHADAYASRVDATNQHQLRAPNALP